VTNRGRAANRLKISKKNSRVPFVKSKRKEMPTRGRGGGGGGGGGGVGGGGWIPQQTGQRTAYHNLQKGEPWGKKGERRAEETERTVRAQKNRMPVAPGSAQHLLKKQTEGDRDGGKTVGETQIGTSYSTSLGSKSDHLEWT